jgi:subfamily B ATP-binding cassette protein MsbA
MIEHSKDHEENRRSSLIGTIRALSPTLGAFRVELVLAIIAMIADAVLTVMRPWPLKVVIDRILSNRRCRAPFIGVRLDSIPHGSPSLLYGACLTTLFIAIGTGLLTYYFTRSLGVVGQRFAFALRRDLFAHMQRLSLRFHDRRRAGDLTVRLTTDINSIQDFVSNGLILLVGNFALLSGMLALMFWLNWRFALISLSATPLLFAAIFRYTRRIKSAARRARRSDGLLASVAQETLASIRIVQGLSQEDQRDERFRLQGESSLEAYLEGIRYQARVAPLVDLLSAIGLVMVMWFGSIRVVSGDITTGDLIVFFAYVTNLYSPMKSLARFSFSASKALIAGDRIADVLHEPLEVADRADARPAPRFEGLIEFRNVSFQYEPENPVLSEIELAISPGECVAIVGSTGAGKSTLAGLIPRLYDPTEGAILIDGENIQSYMISSLRERIALVLQDALLFSGTIRDNIAFGRPDATDEQIVAAAVAANADEFIRHMPEGYLSRVAERGTTLSGGQKQRIAIARAILRDAPILILDEPTSSLDVVSERLVMRALERASTGRTTIIIAHRLATIRFADRVVVLEKGRIVEQGTPAELIARGGSFAGLHRLQSLGEDDNESDHADMLQANTSLTTRPATSVSR